MLTRNGVCYDLSISKFRCKHNGLTFVFSSQLHLDKFESRVKENRDIINYSLTKRFNIPVNVSTLADVVLYRKIETRGFLIEVEEEEIECQKSLRFDGGKMTLQNCKES